MNQRRLNRPRGVQLRQTGSRPGVVAHSLRRIAAVAATSGLAVGGSVFLAATAHAGPDDPVVFADSALAEAVNTKLGQAPGALITEAQAATITELEVKNAGIADIAGIEYLTGLEELNLNDNSVTNLAPLVGLDKLEFLSLYENGITDASALSVMTNLRYLYLDYNSVTNLAPLANMTGLEELSLSENEITDISQLSSMTWLASLYLDDNNIADLSPLAALTELEYLVLYNNQIADLSPLAGLVKLEGLYLNENNVSDLSPLSGLPALEGLHIEDNLITDLSPLEGISTLRGVFAAGNNIADISALASLPELAYVTLYDQTVTMPVGAPGVAIPNPVTTLNGDPVAVAAPDADFSFDVATNTWSFGSAGVKTLEWDTKVMLGESEEEIPFFGTIIQEISPLATLEDPAVTQAICVDGEVMGPQVTLPTTLGIAYTLVGEVAAGATVTINAVAGEGRVLVTAPDSRWSTDSDGVAGTLTVTLDVVECEAPPAEDGETPPREEGETPPVEEGNTPPDAPTKETLAKTGVDNSATTLGALATLLVLTGAVVIASRHRRATR